MTNRQRNADLGKRPLLDRRSALKLGLAGAATLAAPTVLRAETGELHVASLFDLTGNLNIYGIQEMNVSRYAIAEINKASARRSFFMSTTRNQKLNSFPVTHRK
jgi:hypothetical protein